MIDQLFASSQIHVRELVVSVAKDGLLVKRLLAAWHSTLPPVQGWRVAFVMSDGLTIYGVSTWGRPVARMEEQVHTLQHTRMALSPAAPRNSASWFIAQNRKWIRQNLKDITRLIAYIDEAYHTGITYRADNWRIVYEHRVNDTNWVSRAGHRSLGCAVRTKFEREP